VTLRDIVGCAVALTEEAQRVLLFLFRNVASQRFAHQRRYGNTFAARQGVEFLFHGFFNEKCRSFHMTYSGIRQVFPIAVNWNVRGHAETRHGERLVGDGCG
jgi:hypothetical protein